jgi:16S rRNA (guanine(527)-N(7))-methyltransferase RsmG
MTNRIEFIEFKDKYISCLSDNRLYEYSGLSEPMYTLTTLLLEYNAHTNLTAITEPGDIIAKHLADSLAVCRYIPQGASLMDVGAGAGFPSLPVAIARPDVTVTALDSTAKKLVFIDAAAAATGLANINTLNARAESAAHERAFRERFDVVTARAVARLNVLSELCLPYAAVGGKFIAMKGAAALPETEEALTAIRILGGTMTENIMEELIVFGERQKRCTIIIQKNRRSPKNHPRDFSRITKNPL